MMAELQLMASVIVEKTLIWGRIYVYKGHDEFRRMMIHLHRDILIL
jgi:hypothetical protein